ncbi:hypothetical protein L249_2315 [Ophiocordyceps polyrhachis-furcata BCC 54312]|uniref:Uncharacterized protein n=1 Tax=Ophiocordyceps polyrhachis-furcata BCC 54312 TaxID=1330021 RepID=A0A367LNM7_9HYPO|nr:hypothetical protein L249_2315 [Ophiocordyceps polyrhachis-furcata BCC 54312]
MRGEGEEGNGDFRKRAFAEGKKTLFLLSSATAHESGEYMDMGARASSRQGKLKPNQPSPALSLPEVPKPPSLPSLSIFIFILPRINRRAEDNDNDLSLSRSLALSPSPSPSPSRSRSPQHIS